MTIEELHIAIQQGLQNIGAFAYDEFGPEETDLQINSGIQAVLDLLLDPLKRTQTLKELESTQMVLDDFSVLKVKHFNIVTTPHALGAQAIFPIEYRNLLQDKSTVLVECMNGGVSTQQTAIVPNRLISTSEEGRANINPYEETRVGRPISEIIANRTLLIHTNGFTVPSVYIDYIKQPDVIDIITNPTAQVQFPEQTCYKLADYIATRLAKISEQRKVQQLDELRD